MAVGPRCRKVPGDLASWPLPTKQRVGAGLPATAQSGIMESPQVVPENLRGCWR